jgi:hypothetical protein
MGSGVGATQQQLVQALPHARLLPGMKAPPTRHPGAEAELLWEMLPTDAGVQTNRIPLNTSVIERFAARVAKAPLTRGKKRLDPPTIHRHKPRRKWASRRRPSFVVACEVVVELDDCCWGAIARPYSKSGTGESVPWRSGWGLGATTAGALATQSRRDFT